MATVFKGVPYRKWHRDGSSFRSKEWHLVQTSFSRKIIAMAKREVKSGKPISMTVRIENEKPERYKPGSAPVIYDVIDLEIGDADRDAK